MTVPRKPTTKTLRQLAGPRGVAWLHLTREIRVRINALGMRPNKKHHLPGENVSYGDFGNVLVVQATVSPAHGSRRPRSDWNFAIPYRKGEPVIEALHRALSSRAKKYPGRDDRD